LNPTEAEESRPARNNGQYSKHAPENARNDSLTAPSASAIEDDPRKRIINQTQFPEIEPDSIYRSTQRSRNLLAIDIEGQCTDIKWLIAREGKAYKKCKHKYVGAMEIHTKADFGGRHSLVESKSHQSSVFGPIFYLSEDR
jgi:hypothetical protein